mmetsp:Transcript_72434/g.155089  ORF Transcript_72434/g.155089 Transcript_72434/m.155089 type:complete len:242 (-) Transcript_72434:817-1542(-)
MGRRRWGLVDEGALCPLRPASAAWLHAHKRRHLLGRRALRGWCLTGRQGLVHQRPWPTACTRAAPCRNEVVTSRSNVLGVTGLIGALADVVPESHLASHVHGHVLQHVLPVVPGRSRRRPDQGLLHLFEKLLLLLSHHPVLSALVCGLAACYGAVASEALGPHEELRRPASLGLEVLHSVLETYEVTGVGLAPDPRLDTRRCLRQCRGAVAEVIPKISDEADCFCLIHLATNRSLDLGEDL